MPFSFKITGAAAGAYIALNVAALLTALELGLQPLLHKGSGAASYFPFSFNVTLPRPGSPSDRSGRIGGDDYGGRSDLSSEDSTRNTKGVQIRVVLRLVVSLFLPIASEAHDFWIERKAGEFTVVFGHGTQREEYDSSRIKQVKAFDTNGKPISVSHEKKGKEVFLGLSEPPALILVEIDNGYWSKTIYGWKNLPKRKASRVVEANRSLNYSKALLSWSGEDQKLLRRCGS